MIKLTNISKNFSKRTLYSGVNIEIPFNQITCIVGDSGTGKTTLLNLIAGLEKVSGGEIILHKENKIIDMQKSKTSDLVDFVFQDFNLFNDLNIIDNLKIGTQITGKSWNKKETLDNLKKFDFNDEVLKSKASELSGGEKQKLLVLRALDRDAEILLVDEPTSNLDEKSSNQIFQTLKKVSIIKTIVMVTHDLENALKYGNNVYEIKNSRIQMIKKSSNNDKKIEDFKQKKHKKTFINKLVLTNKFAFADYKKHKTIFSLN